MSKVVKEKSAIIEGKPSEGLTVNHSGLNKYMTSDDPNMIKIGKVIEDMVKKITSSGEEFTAVRNDLTIKLPWEMAAHMVSEIDIILERKIHKFQQSQPSEHRETENLVILRHRLQAWAYTTGLISISNTRLPLHPRLHRMVISGTVCGLLMELYRMIEEDLKVEAAGSSSINITLVTESLEKVVQLVSLFSDEDKAITENTFITRLLDLENSDIAPESLHFTEEIDSQIYPDLQLCAAMKRVKLLSEQSQARRTTDTQLYIQFNQLKLDKTKSITRTTGELNRDGLSRQVVVEWKQYEGFWDTDVRQ